MSLTPDSLEWVLSFGLRMLLHGTVLAFLTWLVCKTLLRNARPSVHALVWTIVLIRFLLPPVLPGNLSLSGAIGYLSAEAPTLRPSGPVTPGLAPTGDASARIGSVAAPEAGPTWRVGLLLLYLATLTLLVLRSLWLGIRTSRMMTHLGRADSDLRSQVKVLSRRLGLRRIPRIRTTQEPVSPCVIGLVRPTLVVPVRLLNGIDGASREALLLHELAHLRRGDLAIRLLQNLARTLFFFWPPVWWVCRRIEGFAEMACDQWAVAASQVRPQDYAHSLLEVVKTISKVPTANQRLAFARRGQILEERFEMILNDKKRVSPTVSWIMLPGLALWMVFSLAGGALSGSSSSVSEPGQATKRVHQVRLVGGHGAVDLESVLAQLLENMPEADLDGDGALTVDELTDFAEAEEEEGRGLYIRLELGDDEPVVIGTDDEDTMQRYTVLRRETVEIDSEGEHDWTLHTEDGIDALDFLHQHDADGDGDLSHDELVEHLGSVVSEEGRAVFIRKEVHSFHEDGDEGDEAGFDMTTLSGDLLERHPEIDLDGDGTAQREEIREWLASNPENVFVFRKRLHREGDEGEERELSIQFSGEGHRIHRRVNTSKARSVSIHVVRDHREGEVGGDGEGLHSEESSSRDRRQRFLETHPEADSNGDGQIDQEEAKALARKLQEKGSGN